MGIGKMTIPLFLSTLPEGMTFTVNSIDANTPSGMYTYNQFQISNGQSFSPSDIANGAKNNKRGAKLAELILMTNGFGLQSGPGGSYRLKFTITGRPTAFPDVPEAHISGTLNIGTSEWNFFTRPSETHFTWSLDLPAGMKPLPGPDGSATSEHGSYSRPTPYGGYLADSCITFAYLPEYKAYCFGVNNEQDWLVKILQGAVPAIMAGHVLLWSTVGGWVMPFGKAAVGVVVWAAGQTDKL